MANEIAHHYNTGETLYARIRRRTDSQVYDVDAGGDNFEAWADGSVATYDLPLVDEDGNFYAVDFPSGISAGVYDVGIYRQAGAAPTITDATLAQGVMYWDGTAEMNTSTIDALIDTAQADLDIITGGNGVLIDDDAITEDKYDETTAFPVASEDTGATEIARTGADGDTLKTISDQLDVNLVAQELIVNEYPTER